MYKEVVLELELELQVLQAHRLGDIEDPALSKMFAHR
jgi:hypothetical protein